MQENHSNKFYTLFSLAILGILIFPVGMANFYFGYMLKDSPCIFCWAQRMNMIFIGAVALLVVRFGFKPRYIALLLLIASSGLYESFYHTGSHALEDVGQGFALAIFGLHTQFWALFVFFSVVVLLSLMLFFAPSMQNFKERSLNTLNKSAFWVFFVVVGSNIIQAFFSTGPFPYIGQSDPVRFSWNLKEAVWSMENWGDLKFPRSVLGRRDVGKPTKLSALPKDNDYQHSPLEITKTLEIEKKEVLSLKLNGAITDLSFNEENAILITENQGLYLVSNDLKTIHSHMVLDSYYSATVGSFVGADFNEDENIVIMGNNKTSVEITPNKNANALKNYPYFLEGANSFDEVERNRLKTSRAKNYYIGSARRGDKDTYLVTIPNKRYNDLVIISMLNSDKQVHAEFVPELGDTKLKEKRKLGELHISALALKDNKLYAISKEFNTLLIIDPKTEEIIEVYGLPKEIKNITSASFRDNTLVVTSYEENQNMLYELSNF
ncbi:disulfide bond formation protein B [Helicobacter cetorum]|uniref:disulfide bond formation protein B n=1 Tax=Helicobacter cetorum TaxID=138563 RepID=UPI000CF05336|nr:disulfide bond formation protein B [Helicobacter cetorum]